MIRYVLAALLLAAPAEADPAWVQFFEAEGAQIERTADGAREAVTLPGDVQVLRQTSRTDAGWIYSGIDRSEHGAVGCVSRILSDIKRVAAQCEAVLSASQSTQLDAHLERIAVFYAQNAVPPITAETFLADLNAYSVQDPALQCGEVTEDFVAFADQLTGAASKALIDDLLSAPRLPVMNPCL